MTICQPKREREQMHLFYHIPTLNRINNNWASPSSIADSSTHWLRCRMKNFLMGFSCSNWRKKMSILNRRKATESTLSKLWSSLFFYLYSLRVPNQNWNASIAETTRHKNDNAPRKGSLSCDLNKHIIRNWWSYYLSFIHAIYSYKIEQKQYE